MVAERDAQRPQRFDLAQRLRHPVAWHITTLVLSVIVLALAARHLWFFFDEWAFLVPSGPSLLLQPHVGHWSTTPILVTHALRAIFGVRTYWPFIALSMAVHLAICHLLWRIMNRVGVNPWIAVSLSFLLMLLGAGAENILWAFQFGFMGAMLLGLIIVLLLDTDDLSRGRSIAVVLLSVWSLTFSGTAVPLIVAAALVNLRRRGLRRTILLFAPAGVIYVVWYLVFSRGRGSYFGPQGLGGIFIDVPQYLGHEFVDGLGSIFPFAGFGAVATLILVIWAVVTFDAWAGPANAGYALAAAAVAQAVLTAFSREALGIATAASGRYVYALVSLSLPAIGLCLTWFCRNSRAVISIVVILTLATTAYDAALLLRKAAAMSLIEQTTRERLYAGLALEDKPDAHFASALIPAPEYAPDVTMGDLATMQKEGWIAVGTYDTGALLSVKANVEITVSGTEAPTSSASCTAYPAKSSAATKDGSDATYVYSAHAAPAIITLTDGAVRGDKRQITLHAGWTKLTSDTGDTLNLQSTGEFRFCGG